MWGKVMAETAEAGDRVRVHYTGRLVNGDVFDTSEESEPLEFTVGAGEMIGGFDAGVRGMKVGDTRRIEIEPADAYGERIEQLVNQVPRDQFNLEAEPQVGMSLVLQLTDGNQIPVEITEVSADSITLDANHPLAGETLIFDVRLIEKTAASQ